MMEAASPLTLWENYYVIVGSSAGALIGLQFVVMTLVAEGRSANDMLQIRAFGTPTVVHFCATLLIAAIISSPWPNIPDATIALAACGIVGLAYSISVIRHARRQTGYKPDAEDWAWYIVLPLLAYINLCVASVLLHWHTTLSLFQVAATALLLLFIGIHNSWDTVTYVAIKRSRDKKEHGEPE